ncbi:hemagglutinin repeat-containing protein [Acinetobacter towneri]|nr:hemagglutinin repeat-containing protein [Acinetobacter towneri]
MKSQGDTTLKGAQAKANRIDADVGGNLNIISQQDTLDQKNKQMGVGARVQVSVGTAWDASGNFNNSSAAGNSKQVNQQSGLFAGDGGYHVKADHVDLQGGAIASTASKENNDLTANSLKFSNIENESSHKATTVALSGGTRFGEEKGTDSTGKTYTNNVNWRDSTTFSPTLPQQDKDSDSSTTYATITAGNINIGGKDTTVEKLGIHSDINTANQKVDALPDLQAILDKQKIVSDATSTIVAATRTYSQNKQAEAEAQKQAAEAQALEKLKAEGGEKWAEYNSTDDYVTKQNLLKNALPAYKDAADQAQTWGMGGNSSRALNAVTTAITAALGGQTDLQVVTNTLAPYAAQVIGQEFGHGADKNTAAQLVSHAILGATLAYINGSDPTAGGSAAVASEAAANYLTNQLAERYKDDPKYFVNGEFQANLLSEAEKAQIRDLTAGIGAVIGGAVGDSTYNAQLAGVIGQNAVENNQAGAHKFAKKQVDQYNNLCAQSGISSGQCSSWTGQRIINNSKELAMIIVPTEIYEVVPVGKAYGILAKGSKKIIATVQDSKQAQKILKNIEETKVVTDYFKQDRKYWTSEPIQFNGNKVYQRNDIFDPNYLDKKSGKTNLQLMEMGRAPIGKDGKSVNLHHMLQKQDGPIAEVTQSFHKDNHATIHINDNSIPSGINRADFNKWRSNYWKNRALGLK